MKKNNDGFKWIDNIYHTNSMEELEEIYNELVKKDDREAMEELEHYMDIGYFWVEDK